MGRWVGGRELFVLVTLGLPPLRQSVYVVFSLTPPRLANGAIPATNLTSVLNFYPLPRRKNVWVSFLPPRHPPFPFLPIDAPSDSNARSLVAYSFEQLFLFHFFYPCVFAACNLGTGHCHVTVDGGAKVRRGREGRATGGSSAGARLPLFLQSRRSCWAVETRRRNGVLRPLLCGHPEDENAEEANTRRLLGENAQLLLLPPVVPGEIFS